MSFLESKHHCTTVRLDDGNCALVTIAQECLFVAIAKARGDDCQRADEPGVGSRAVGEIGGKSRRARASASTSSVGVAAAPNLSPAQSRLVHTALQHLWLRFRAHKAGQKMVQKSEKDENPRMCVFECDVDLREIRRAKTVTISANASGGDNGTRRVDNCTVRSLNKGKAPAISVGSTAVPNTATAVVSGGWPPEIGSKGVIYYLHPRSWPAVGSSRIRIAIVVCVERGKMQLPIRVYGVTTFIEAVSPFFLRGTIVDAHFGGREVAGKGTALSYDVIENGDEEAQTQGQELPHLAFLTQEIGLVSSTPDRDMYQALVRTWAEEEEAEDDGVDMCYFKAFARDPDVVLKNRGQAGGPDGFGAKIAAMFRGKK